MPVTRRFEVKQYLEDFEEMDEHFPLFSPQEMEEEELSFEKNNAPFKRKSFLEKVLAFFKINYFSKS